MLSFDEKERETTIFCRTRFRQIENYSTSQNKNVDAEMRLFS